MLKLVAAAVLVLLATAAAHAASLDPEAATQAYLHSLPEAARHKSDTYFEGGYWLLLWNALLGVAISALLLWTRASARMRDAATRLGRRRWPAHAIYAALYAVVTTLLAFPLTVYELFFREHAYGLATQGFGAWLGDQGIQLAVSVVTLAILVPIVYAVIRRAPRSWWLWASGVVVLFLVVQVVIGPVFLEPLFNHFSRLGNGPLRDQILSLARSNGVPATDVWQFDASRQTTRISAHVSGLLGTTRISLNDNLLKQCTPDQILAVLGHEMGHYVMGHVFTLVLELAALVAAGFALVRAAGAALIRRFGATWDVHGIDDVAGLPALAACFTILGLLATPVLNTMIRRQEMQADLFGLNLARRPDAFAEVALKLSTYRKLDPSPLEELIFFDHPSGHTRIFTAMRWKAEQQK